MGKALGWRTFWFLGNICISICLCCSVKNNSCGTIAYSRYDVNANRKWFQENFKTFDIYKKYDVSFFKWNTTIPYQLVINYFTVYPEML